LVQVSRRDRVDRRYIGFLAAIGAAPVSGPQPRQLLSCSLTRMQRDGGTALIFPANL
jgi:hypothetical protein